MLYYFGGKARYWSKIAIFSYPVRAGSYRNIPNSPCHFERKNYTVSQKTCDHIFDDKLNENCPFTKIFGTLISKNIGHRQVFLVFHLTYGAATLP